MSEQLFHVGIKGLLTNDDGKVLLLQVNKKKLSEDQPAYWDIPGGRIQKNDNVKETLSREILEETGVETYGDPVFFAATIANIFIPTKEHGKVGLVLMVYSVKVVAGKTIKLSDEHVAYEWVDRQEAASRLSHKFPKEFTEKLLHKTIAN